MKRKLIVILFIISVFNLPSQEIVVSNYIWSNLEEHCHVWGSAFSTDYFHFDKDTIIENITYKKVWISQDENHVNWDFYGAFIREENNRVYYRKLFGDEGLIYDFNLEIGDSVLIDNPRAVSQVWLTLTEIDTIETEIETRERWKMESSQYPIPDYWIRGIGSTAGVINSSTSVFGGLCGLYELLCQEDDDYLVYVNEEYQSCYIYTVGDYEKPAYHLTFRYDALTGTLFIDNIANEFEQLSIFDISGQIVLEMTLNATSHQISVNRLPSGIYILYASSISGSTSYKFIK